MPRTFKYLLLKNVQLYTVSHFIIYMIVAVALTVTLLNMSLYKAQVVFEVPDSNCLKHGRKQVLHFCKTCNKSGCSTCMQTKHRHHDWCVIQDIVGEKQRELGRNIEILETEILPKLTEKKKKFINGQSVDKNDIDRQADAIIELTNKYRRLLKSKVDSSRTTKGPMIGNLDHDIADVEGIIRNSKKSIAIQAKPEIVQGNETVNVAIAEVRKSLEIEQCPSRCFRRGDIDSQVLQRMFGEVYSGFNCMATNVALVDVTLKVKNIISVGTHTARVCPVGRKAWVMERTLKNIVLMDVNGEQIIVIRSTIPQCTSLDNNGNIYMCSFESKWIYMMTTDQRFVDVVCTKPLHPTGICVTQSGYIMVSLVDVSRKIFGQCKESYVAKLDRM